MCERAEEARVEIGFGFSIVGSGRRSMVIPRRVYREDGVEGERLFAREAREMVRVG